MFSRNVRTHGADFAVVALPLAILLLVRPDSLGAVSYAAVAAVLMALAVTIRIAIAKGQDSQTLGQLMTRSDPGIFEPHRSRKAEKERS